MSKENVVIYFKLLRRNFLGNLRKNTKTLVTTVSTPAGNGKRDFQGTRQDAASKFDT